MRHNDQETAELTRDVTELSRELATLKRQHAQLRAAAELEEVELLTRIQYADVQYRASLAVMTNAEFDGLVDRYQRLRAVLDASLAEPRNSAPNPCEQLRAAAEQVEHHFYSRHTNNRFTTPLEGFELAVKLRAAMDATPAEPVREQRWEDRQDDQDNDLDSLKQKFEAHIRQAAEPVRETFDTEAVRRLCDLLQGLSAQRLVPVLSAMALRILESERKP